MSSPQRQTFPPASQSHPNGTPEASEEQNSILQHSPRHSERRLSLSRSTTSVDSQTVLLDNPSVTPESQETEVENAQPSQPSEEEPAKCWICFEDTTEDSPASSRWRSPCSCALTAHESCLLDWVANLEAPSSRRSAGKSAKVQCPQCKKDIVIARPRNYVLEALKVVDRGASKLVVPGILTVVMGCIYTGATIHGVASTALIFGEKDFRALIGNPNRLSAKSLFAFPLIPLVLILSRTTIADGLLPALPIAFLMPQVASSRQVFRMPRALWPPSAMMTIAMLPYIRAAYNELYKRVFAKRELQWLKEVQPRAGENNGAGQDGENPGAAGNDDEGGVQLELDFQMDLGFGGRNPQPEQQDNVQDNERNRGQEQVNDAELADVRAEVEAAIQEEQGRQGNAQQEQGDGNADPAPNRNGGQNRAQNVVVATSRVADAMMGSLCFPLVASAMGLLLRLGLPQKWTTSVRGSTPGILQTRWGRSIVGGCLFVVLKDSLFLYARYRTARDHRLRKVMNYDKASGRYMD